MQTLALSLLKILYRKRKSASQKICKKVQKRWKGKWKAWPWWIVVVEESESEKECVNLWYEFEYHFQKAWLEDLLVVLL